MVFRLISNSRNIERIGIWRDREVGMDCANWAFKSAKRNGRSEAFSYRDIVVDIGSLTATAASPSNDDDQFMRAVREAPTGVTG